MTTILIGIVNLFSMAVYGSDFMLNIIAGDTIVKMHGHITDTLSQSPASIGVKAKIVLESLPHGSEIGIITSNDSSGYYEYYINLKYSYRIEINSEGHRYFVENFKPRAALRDGEIKRNYYLEPQIKENQLIRLNDLIFDQGESLITSDSYGELNRLANIMKENESIQIQLEGHTDYRGSKKLNMELSQKRVDAVRNYLIGKEINPKRIKTKAFGGSQPLIKEKSIEASELNRRVEVRILKVS
ncbi:MAG: OmpA family protein [Cyclobacteriaceae bacterium]|nr:OmpA family protein [Cyclobacteriaceae bacterium]